MRNLTVNKRVLLWVGCVAGVLGIAGTCWLCYVIVTVNSRAHMAKPGEVLFEVAGFATALCLIISIAVGICDLLGTEPVSYRWEINRGTTVRTSTAGDPQRGRFVTIDDD